MTMSLLVLSGLSFLIKYLKYPQKSFLLPTNTIGFTNSSLTIKSNRIYIAYTLYYNHYEKYEKM